jgi:hypothetical protein
MYMRSTSQRQTRSLDNIVENPDHWRFNDNRNAHLEFINEAKGSALGSTTNSSELIEK